MIVECPNRAFGCVHTCQRLLLPAHLKDSCSYAEVTCADMTCSKRMLRYELNGHVHAAASDDTTRDSRTDKSEVSLTQRIGTAPSDDHSVSSHMDQSRMREVKATDPFLGQLQAHLEHHWKLKMQCSASVSPHWRG